MERIDSRFKKGSARFKNRTATKFKAGFKSEVHRKFKLELKAEIIIEDYWYLKTNLQKILEFGTSNSLQGFLQSASSSDHSPSSRHVTFVTTVSPAPLVGRVPFLHFNSHIVSTSRSNVCLFASRHFTNFSFVSSRMSRQYVGSSSHSSTSYSIPKLEIILRQFGASIYPNNPLLRGCNSDFLSSSHILPTLYNCSKHSIRPKLQLNCCCCLKTIEWVIIYDSQAALHTFGSKQS